MTVPTPYAGRFSIEADAIAERMVFVPGAPEEEVLTWSIRIHDSDSADHSDPRRELIVVTRQRSFSVELLRVIDVLLAVGIRVALPAEPRGAGFLLIGEVAPEAWPPPWADQQADPLDSAKHSWLADYDYDEAEPGVSLFHTRNLLPAEAIPTYLTSSEQPTVQLTQSGWASGGLIIYNSPTVFVSAPGIELVDARLTARFAAAFEEAARVHDQILTAGVLS
jgi:hypothetical protein